MNEVAWVFALLLLHGSTTIKPYKTSYLRWCVLTIIMRPDSVLLLYMYCLLLLTYTFQCNNQERQRHATN